MYHILFPHSSIIGHLVAFMFWLLQTMPLRSFMYKFGREPVLSFLLGMYSGVELMAFPSSISAIPQCPQVVAQICKGRVGQGRHLYSDL
jgi:hypothetical protein